VQEEPEGHRCHEKYERSEGGGISMMSEVDAFATRRKDVWKQRIRAEVFWGAVSVQGQKRKENEKICTSTNVLCVEVKRV
jgi:hypothetical protein